MHELSIAQAIADVARRHAAGRRVIGVEVRIGHLRQVVPDALAFSFALVAQGTELEGAELELTETEAGGRCRTCGADGAFHAFPLTCGTCGSWDVEVTRGEELLVEALELEELGERETAMSGGAT
jgi:hydrogenase nickel incorporation protein HypA/HybF